MKIVDNQLVGKKGTVAFEFEKLQCVQCHRIVYGCPVCYVLMRMVLPHRCFSNWVEKMLLLLCGPIMNYIQLSYPCSCKFIKIAGK